MTVDFTWRHTDLKESYSHYLCSLHEMIMAGSKEFEKEEMLMFFIQLLIERYGQPFEKCIPDCRDEIEQACIFMQQHFEEHITLERLCGCSNLSKSTLLRAFTKSKGVTPYRYLQAIRIGKAKELLESGAAPAKRQCRPDLLTKAIFPISFICLSDCLRQHTEVFSRKEKMKNETAKGHLQSLPCLNFIWRLDSLQMSGIF